MDLPSSTVWDVLADKGVEKLHHANSVLTSCQFLRQKALLSRGVVERSGLKQTAQTSDTVDRRYSLWFDVFADGVDIHDRASRINQYGPVVFVLDTEALRDIPTGRIWVTKLNPTKWKGVPREERWFQSRKDLEDNFVYGTFDQMIVFRHCGGLLPIEDCLKEIIIDDLDQSVGGYDLASTAFGALTLAMSDSGLEVPIVKRDCVAACTCRRHYTRKSNEHRTIEMFFPFT